MILQGSGVHFTTDCTPQKYTYRAFPLYRRKDPGLWLPILLRPCPLFFSPFRPPATTSSSPPFLLSFRLVARACYEIWITKCTGDGARSSVTGRRKLLMWGTRRRRSPTWPRFFNVLWCDVGLFEHSDRGSWRWSIGKRHQNSDALCEVDSYFRCRVAISAVMISICDW